MSENTLLLSIRPRYAEKIFAGAKTIELRRIRPKRMEKGDQVFIYVSSPVKALAGVFKIDRIIEEPLQELWKTVKDKAGITHEEFHAYYNGLSSGIGISFKEVWQLPEAIELHNLRIESPNFRPPQGFRYITKNELAVFSFQHAFLQ